MRTRGLWLLLAIAGCADAPVVHEVAQPIVNGTVDGGDLSTVYLDVGCTGILVSPRTVLTADHCLEPEMAVFFGTNADAAGTWVDVVEGQGHPYADLAMLVLAEDAPSAAVPVPLNADDLEDQLGGTIRITGFGVTSENGAGDGIKRKAVARLDSVDDELMYATNWPSGTCYGDSGGPNFMTIDGVEVLIGVTSFGTEECGTGLDASVRVDAFHDWIADYIAEYDETIGGCVECLGKSGGGAGNAPSGPEVSGGCAAGGADASLGAAFVLACMLAWRRGRRRGAALAIALSGCIVGEDVAPDGPGLDDDFAAAARRFDVPADVLKAVSYVETRWQMVVGDDHHGHVPAVGLFGLTGDNLTLGAAAAGVDPLAVASRVDASIAAGAARIAMLARGHAVTDDVLTWRPVLGELSQTTDPEVRAAYVEEIMQVLATGAREIAEDGTVIASIAPHAGIELPSPHDGARALVDFPGAVWRASPNHNGRGGTPISLVVIHSCEGSYVSCWSTLRQPDGVSAHYVVNQNGSEVTQLVRESNRAYHVAAAYDCARAGNEQCELDGVSTNTFSVGVEHAGFASGTWSPGQLDTSAELVCEITRRYGIPRDRDHIVAHGQLQPWNRIDPGPNWPWADYIDRVRAHCGDDIGDDTGTGGGDSVEAPIIVDSNTANNDPEVARLELAGTWTASTSTPGYFGTGYWVAQTSPTTAPATFWFYLPASATRSIDAWWTAGSDRSTSAVFIATNAAGEEVGRRTVDQQANGSHWVPIGTWSFTPGWNKVMLSRWAPQGSVVIADAVRIR